MELHHDKSDSSCVCKLCCKKKVSAVIDANAQEIRAHFSGIRNVIVKEILAANCSIIVAVAWLTDPEIIEALLATARKRVVVRIALLKDQNNSRGVASFEQLRSLGGSVFLDTSIGRRHRHPAS
jgi:hypothetical protein